jgi:hypothetical protein
LAIAPLELPTRSIATMMPIACRAALNFENSRAGPAGRAVHEFSTVGGRQFRWPKLGPGPLGRGSSLI